MDNNNVRRILENLAATAGVAATQAREAVQTAGKAVSGAVSEKYDAVKLSLELARLKAEQDRVFKDLGRVMFLSKSGLLDENAPVYETEKTPQQIMDTLLMAAEQVQQQIENVEEKLAEESGGPVCPVCGRMCDVNDAFCAVCGAKLAGESKT